MTIEFFSLKQSSNLFRIDSSPAKHNREALYSFFTPTETVIRAAAAPMLTNRIIKIIDGRSFSSDASVPFAVAAVLLSMLNGSTAGAGAAAAGAGAEVLNQDGDADIVYE